MINSNPKEQKKIIKKGGLPFLIIGINHHNYIIKQFKKSQNMKKVLFAFVLAAGFAACNSSSTDATATDSTKVDSSVAAVDSAVTATVDSAKAAIDSTAAAAIDTVKAKADSLKK